jgi:ferric-dicitrate binding protein FerR (iron transport regulator)
MRATTCEEIEDLIEREALGWSEADRLRVEQHLSECAACRETLAISRFVRDTLRDAAGELSDTGRTRAINAALLRGRPAKSLRPVPRRVLGVSALVLSVAAAAGLALYLVEPASELARTTQPAQPVQGPAAPGGAGPVELPKEVQQLTAPESPRPELAQGEVASRAERAWIDSVAPERHRFAHAEVELAAATRVRFDADSHTLELAHGRVDLDVDPTRAEPFSVLTEHFRVEVLGTRFSVTPNSVSVTRGRVQVFGRDGSVLARELAAGGSYHYGAVSPRLTQPGSQGLGIGAAAESKAPSAARAQQAGSEPSSARTPTPSAAPVKSAAAWLHEARESLARGDAQATRALVGSAESSSPTRGERAEASTLRAEAALLERDHAAALRLYREVGDRYADLAAGDNAAFAAAQLAARADKAHERELLESYLARFPAGRFRDEAKQRLARLGGQ